MLKKKVQFISLGLALLTRFVILFFTSYILSMQKPIFQAILLDTSAKDLLMIAGGLFLIIKSSKELLWNNIFFIQVNRKKINIKSQLFSIILQIILIDLIFSIDSLLTAIALTNNIIIIAVAYTFSTLVMILLSGYTTKLIRSNPSLKTIAILFIFFVGAYLMLEGLHIKLPKKYLYSSLILAFLIEVVNKIKKI